MCSIAFNLLIRRDRTEHYFGESATFEGTICDPSHNFERLSDDGYGQMGFVVYQPRNVIFWHLRQLFLKYAFQAGKNDIALSCVVIVHHSESNLALLFLDYGRLLWKVDVDRSGRYGRIALFSLRDAILSWRLSSGFFRSRRRGVFRGFPLRRCDSHISARSDVRVQRTDCRREVPSIILAVVS